MDFAASQGLVTLVLCFLLLIGFTLWFAYRFGPNKALAITSLVCLIFPFWICIKPYGVEIHLVLAVAVADLGVYLIHPKSVFRAKLVLLDYLMIAMVLINVISDFMNTGPKPFIFLQAYGEWFVAYVVGRLSFSHFENIRDLQAVGAAVAIVLATLSIIECLTFVNWFLLLDFEGTDIKSQAMRWGFRRSCGPTSHPIYFGTLLLLIYPWVIQNSIWRYQSTKNLIYIFLIVIMGAGICGTLSRSPIMAMGFLVAVPMFIFYIKSRRPIAIITGLTIVTFCLWPTQILELVEKIGAERDSSARARMVVDGTEVASGSANARVHLLYYYKTAIMRAGYFGYGSDATSTFPPRVPSGGNSDLSAMQNLKWIDNQYLLFTLRFGYLGVACWSLALGCAAWNFFYLSTRCPIDLKWFCASNAGALIATMFIQWTVWMPQDYGFYLIWLLGGSSGLLAAHKLKKEQKHSDENKLGAAIKATRLRRWHVVCCRQRTRKWS